METEPTAAANSRCDAIGPRLALRASQPTRGGLSPVGADSVNRQNVVRTQIHTTGLRQGTSARSGPARSTERAETVPAMNVLLTSNYLGSSWPSGVQ